MLDMLGREQNHIASHIPETIGADTRNWPNTKTHALALEMVAAANGGVVPTDEEIPNVIEEILAALDKNPARNSAPRYVKALGETREVSQILEQLLVNRMTVHRVLSAMGGSPTTELRLASGGNVSTKIQGMHRRFFQLLEAPTDRRSLPSPAPSDTQLIEAPEPKRPSPADMPKRRVERQIDPNLPPTELTELSKVLLAEVEKPYEERQRAIKASRELIFNAYKTIGEFNESDCETIWTRLGYKINIFKPGPANLRSSAKKLKEILNAAGKDFLHDQPEIKTALVAFIIPGTKARSVEDIARILNNHFANAPKDDTDMAQRYVIAGLAQLYDRTIV
jgi:hypothetical protein